MKTSALTVVVAMLAIAGTHAQSEVQAVQGWDHFQEWSRLVWAHTPGELDDAARTVAAWPRADLSDVSTDLRAAVGLLNSRPKPGAVVRYTVEGEWLPSTRMGNPNARLRTLRSADLPDLLRLPGTRPMRELDDRVVTQFLKRAAMLHTDAAIFAPTANDVTERKRTGDRNSSALRIVDGQDKGWEPNPFHWEIARAALDGVRPNPANDLLVSMWYQATSAWQGLRRDYGYLAPQLERGRAIFMNDATLHLYSGIMHEAYAAPMVQTALQTLSSNIFRPTVKSAAEELKLAEGFFRRALDIDQGAAAARVHLGHVLGLLGRHKEAVVELRQALPSLTDPRQRYLAELFLGSGEQALGRSSEAAGAFQRASLLFPNAQSPYLALSQLAWQAADRTAAQAAFQSMATLPAAGMEREDPWWTYDVSALLDAEDLINRLWSMVAEDLAK